MKNRVPTLDEYIAESMQILEGKKFNWNAKTLAKARQDNNDDDEEITPENLEVSLWVTLANQLNIFNVEAWYDYADEFSLVGATKDGVVIGIDSEIERNGVSLHIYRVKPEDPKEFKEEIDGISPSDWRGVVDSDDITQETVSYDPDKMNLPAVSKQVDKILKKFIQIMK